MMASASAQKRHRGKAAREEEDEVEEVDGLLRLRTQIRTQYRTLITEVGELKEEMIQPGSHALRDALERGDSLFEHVSAPREAALDSEFLSLCSGFASEQANRLSTQMKSYDVPSYIHQLSLFLRGKLVINEEGLAVPATEEKKATLKRKRPRRTEEDEEEAEVEAEEEDEDEDERPMRWADLGALVAGFAQSTPSLDCLAGAMVATPKEKKVRAQRARREKPGEKVEPEAITNTKALDMEGQTAKRVAIAKKKLEQAKRKGFFEYIVDPDSYSQTIENMFHLSFLVRNGMASVDLDDSGQPVLEPKSPPDEDDYQEGLERKQCVVRLDYDLFQNLINAYHIQQSFLPHRTKDYSQSATQSSQRSTQSGTSSARKAKLRRITEEEDDENDAGENGESTQPHARSSSKRSAKGKEKRVSDDDGEDDEDAQDAEATRKAKRRR